MKHIGLTGLTVVSAAAAIYATQNRTKNISISDAYCIKAEAKQAELSVNNSDTTNNKSLSLVNVHVFFRHGARTPIHWITTPEVHDARWDPYLHLRPSAHTEIDCHFVNLEGEEFSAHNNPVESRYFGRKLPGGSATGQLTRNGQDQMYKLGRRLRQRYMDQFKIIPNLFDPETVFCRSTGVRRNLQSMECLLSGLYYLDKDSPEFNTPIVHTCVAEKETLYPNKKVCICLGGYRQKGEQVASQLPEVLKVKEELKEILGVPVLKNRFGKTVARGTDCPIYHVRDDFIARIHHGHYVPPEMINIMPTLNRLSSTELIYEFMGGNSLKALSLAIGPVISMLLDSMATAVSSKSTTVITKKSVGNPTHHKLSLFATHDSMLIPLLVGLDAFDGNWPPFGADLIFELYQDTLGENWVQILYCGKPMILTQFGATKECPLIPMNVLTKHLSQYAIRLEDYKKECSLRALPNVKDEHPSYIPGI